MRVHAVNIASGKGSVKRVGANISSVKRHSKRHNPEDWHQSFLDFVNLLPLKAWNPDVQRDSWSYLLDSRWRKVWKNITEPNGPFDAFLDRHFSIAEFPEFRKYLAEGDPRFPFPTPVDRWNWITSMNRSMRVWALGTDPDDHVEVSPWAQAGGWKPEGICCICDKLFPLTRKDRKTCDEQCAGIHRTREWRKRKESGATKVYREAKKRKQAKGGKR